MTRNFISTGGNFDDSESGYEQRLKEMNRKIYKVGKTGQESHYAMTEFDRTMKGITSIGGFPHYGVVKDDYLLIKGCCLGSKKLLRGLQTRKEKSAKRSYTRKCSLHGHL